MTIYSHSRLSTFETCPRRYWYGYIDQPDVERVDTVEAFLGSRVHDALEELYRRGLDGCVMSSDELLECYESKWAQIWRDNVRIVMKDRDADDYRQVGGECLRKYHASYHPFDQERTVALEMHVEFDLDGGERRMQGYIDRLSQRADGVYEIRDYKTSSKASSQAQADSDRQLALYQVGIQQTLDDVEDVELVWHFVRFDREIRSRRTGEQLEEVKRQCVGVIEDIESRGRDEANFPAEPAWLCRWCDFMDICPFTR